MLLVPLAGHSRGHTGVAIRTGEGWLLHCGDAYFHHGEIATPPSCPPGLRFFQNLNTPTDDQRPQANQERLRELAAAPRRRDRPSLLARPARAGRAAQAQRAGAAAA